MKTLSLSLLTSLGCALLLVGCLDSGPQKPLNAMARALTERDSALFLAQMDGKTFAANTINALTREDPALRTLDAVGKMLGLGGMEDLVNSVVDMHQRQQELFTRGVSTGELVLECTRATKPNCPWVPEALKAAKVRKLGDTAAIAQVTTPARLTSWLALRKVGENWLVVGQAPLEATAQAYATGAQAATQTGAPQQPRQPGATRPQAPQKPEAPTTL